MCSLRIGPFGVKKLEKEFWQGTLSLRIGPLSVKKPEKEFWKCRYCLRNCQSSVKELEIEFWQGAHILRIGYCSVKEPEKEFWQSLHSLRIGQSSVKEPEKEFWQGMCLILEFVRIVSRSQKRSFCKVYGGSELVCVIFFVVCSGWNGLTLIFMIYELQGWLAFFLKGLRGLQKLGHPLKNLF